MKRVALAFSALFLIHIAGPAVASPGEVDPTPPSPTISIHAGLVFPEVDLYFAPTGDSHEIQDLEIESQTGWRVRADVALAVSNSVAFAVGVGLIQEKFVVNERGFFPDPEGVADPVFAVHATSFEMLRLEVPLKVTFYPLQPKVKNGRPTRESVYFSLGPKISFNLFGDNGFASPRPTGLRGAQAPVAFEFGGGILFGGPAGRRILFAVDYSVDLTDRFKTEFRNSGYSDAPYNTWGNLKLQTLGVSLGVVF